MSKKIIFTSGGTGGHIFPAINLMKYFSKKGYEVLLVTDERGNYFLKNFRNFKTIIIKAETTTNKKLIKKFFYLFIIFFSILKSSKIILEEKPDLIIGFGGYASFPISFASMFCKVPLVIYENNLTIGRANKKLLKISKKILLGLGIPKSLPEKYKKKVYQVGSILRQEIYDYKYIEKKDSINFISILILGGSQGAEIFGKIIPPTIKMLKDKGYEIKINQQCIEKQKKTLVEFYKKNKINSNIFTFDSNILNLISESDLAISRCGASTTAELVNTLTPFIAVPYPYSMDNHQTLNAEYYENKDCCWNINQNDFNTINLFNLLISIIKDKKKLKNIRENMAKNDSKDTFIKIEKAIKEFI